MRSRSLVIIVIGLLAFPLVASFGQLCPGLNLANHKTNLYDLSYDSWVKKAEKGDLFIFGRCVQTNNKEVVLVDWKKAEVKGYVQPGKPCQNEIPAPTKDEIIVKSDFHFGAKQEKFVAAPCASSFIQKNKGGSQSSRHAPEALASHGSPSGQFRGRRPKNSHE